MDILKQIVENLQQGNNKRISELVRQALKQKIPAKEILDNGLIAGMDIIGKQFKAHKIFLPEVLLSARA
ncbi:MAG: B12-binding domain-containing protein, partial [candidate division WOR-3 bacterium]|nr:B12-binding domain-containing protein [candidate division WOR-3 bacterium]